jgi:uncharacterized membrane protein
MVGEMASSRRPLRYRGIHMADRTHQLITAIWFVLGLAVVVVSAYLLIANDQIDGGYSTAKGIAAAVIFLGTGAVYRLRRFIRDLRKDRRRLPG